MIFIASRRHVKDPVFTGKVGIGTSTPGTSLDINDLGTTSLDTITARRAIGSAGDFTGMLFGSTTTAFSGALRYVVGASGTGRVGIFVGDNAGNALTERFAITSEGVCRFLDSGAKPTASAAIRGGIWYDAGGAGVADTFEVCRKDAADAYAWVSLF